MNQLTSRSLLFFCGVLIACFHLAAQPLNLDQYEWRSKKIAKGLYWQHLQAEQLLGGPQHINVLRIKTNKRPVELVFNHDSLQLTSSFAQNSKARAAINGSYFNTLRGESVTYLKADGQVISGNSSELDAADSELIQGALAITDRGRVIIEPARPETFYELSEEYRDVLVSGPLLVVDGAPRSLADNKFNNNRHPRSCACKTRKKELLLVTVDGRNAQSQGMTLSELTRLMLSLGCKQVINLDGGGSTTLWITGQSDNGIVNHPSDNGIFDNKGEREIANAILIY